MISSYREHCELLWRSWTDNTLTPSARLSATFDLSAAPEPWLPLCPGDRPLVALTTNPGRTRDEQLQRRVDIMSGDSRVKPQTSYAEAAAVLAAYYKENLQGTARRRITSLEQLSAFAGFHGVLQVESCPFHSPSLPNKRELMRLSAAEPLLAGYVQALRSLIAAHTVVVLSAAGTGRSLWPVPELSAWLYWQADLVGLNAAKAECVPLVTRGDKVTCAALVDGSGTRARALVLMMGGNHLPREAGLRRLAEAIKNVS